MRTTKWRVVVAAAPAALWLILFVGHAALTPAGAVVEARLAQAMVGVGGAVLGLVAGVVVAFPKRASLPAGAPEKAARPRRSPVVFVQDRPRSLVPGIELPSALAVAAALEGHLLRRRVVLAALALLASHRSFDRPAGLDVLDGDGSFTAAVSPRLDGKGRARWLIVVRHPDRAGDHGTAVEVVPREVTDPSMVAAIVSLSSDNDGELAVFEELYAVDADWIALHVLAAWHRLATGRGHASARLAYDGVWKVNLSVTGTARDLARMGRALRTILDAACVSIEANVSPAPTPDVGELFGPPAVIAVAGVPGRGKTTAVKRIAALAEAAGVPTSVVCPDAIARKKFGSVAAAHAAGKMAEVWAAAYAALGAKLADGELVLLDATLVHPEWRAEILRIAAETGARTALIAFRDTGPARLRNARRSGDERVPDDRLAEIIDRWEEEFQTLASEPWGWLLRVTETELGDPVCAPDPFGLTTVGA